VAIGQLGDPGLVGVTGQGHQSGGEYPRQVQLAGSKGPNSLQAVQCTHQSGDRGCERRAPQQIQLRAALPFGRLAGVGLPSMAARAAELGGHCAVARLDGGGTQVMAHLPLAAA